jgi:hypothetical protein
MPRPSAIAAESCAEIVDRVPKLTSFSIVARMRSADTCCSAAEIRLSATIGCADSPASCAHPLLTANASETTNHHRLLLKGEIM